MKRITFSRKQILRAIHAACVALFFAACAGRAEAQAHSGDFLVNGSTVTVLGSADNTSSAYFSGSSPNAYAITVQSGAILVNNTDAGGTPNLISFDHGSVNNAGSLTASLYTVVINSTTATSTVSNSDLITSTGNYAVLIRGNATVSNYNGATISSTGGASSAVKIYGVGTVNNAGTISGKHDGVHIVETGTVNNSSTGIITSASGNYDGVEIDADGTVNNAGSISGYKAGVYIEGAGGSSSVMNSNSITDTNSAYYSAGVGFGGTKSSYGSSSFTLTNNSGGTISGYTNNTTGTDSTYAYGVNAESYNGNISITNNADGTIMGTAMSSKSNAYGYGIYTASSNNGSITITNGGTATGSATTTAAGYTATAAGISASSYNGNISITNNKNGLITGTASGYGDTAYGIEATSTQNGNVTVNNSGEVEATVSYAYGVGNAGTAYGISASANYGNVSVTNATGGFIEASGTGQNGTGKGISATDTNFGTITVSNSGTVEAMGTGSSTYSGSASGIYTYAEGGNISISNNSNGVVSASSYGFKNDSSFAIYAADGDFGSITIYNGGLAVATSTAVDGSASAYGIYASSNYDGNVMVTNNGQAEGEATPSDGTASGYGIAAGSMYGNVTVLNNGLAVGTGTASDAGAANGTGIGAGSFSGDVTVTNNNSAFGSATAAGNRTASAYGIKAGSVYGDITVTNNSNGEAVGTASSYFNGTAADALGYGISASSFYGTARIINNTNSLADGSGSGNNSGSGYGIYSSNTNSGYISITNNGTVEGTGSAASGNGTPTGMGYGIYASGNYGNISITNNGIAEGIGTATVAGGSASATADGISAKTNSGYISILNTGTSEGTASGFYTGTGSGIYALTNTGGISIVNKGTAEGAASNLDSTAGVAIAYGIYAVSTVDGPVTITNTGTAIATATSGIANFVDYSFSPAYASGILVGTPSNEGNIVVTNTGTAEGFANVNGSGSGYGYGIDILSTSGNVTITNSGLAEGTGSSYAGGNNIGYGIAIQPVLGTVSITNTITGVIAGAGYSTSGFAGSGASYGIYLFHNGSNPQGAATINNSGTISAYYGIGIFAHGYTNSITINEIGGAITTTTSGLYDLGGPDAMLLGAGETNTVKIVGQANITGLMDGGYGGDNTLTLQLAGMTPAQKAALQAAVIASAGGGPSGPVFAGGVTYSWVDFQNVSGTFVSLEQAVDPGLENLALRLDKLNTPLPVAFGPFYAAAATGNVESAMNELVGREINQGIDTIGVSLNTTFASNLDQHLDNIFTGNEIGGFDVGGLHISDAGSMIAFSDTSSQLDSLLRMTGTSAFGGTEMSTDGKTMVSAPPPPSWGVWASGNVTLADDTGTGGLSNFHSTFGSPTLGFDYRVTPNLVLGIIGSYTTGGADFDDGNRIGLDAYIGALYGTWRDGNWHVNGIAGGGALQLDDSRTTFGGTASSGPGGYDIITDWTGGYDFHLGDNWNITPELGLQYAHLDVNSYTETGAGAFDLSDAEQGIDSLRSHVGFNLNKSFSLGKDLTFVPELRAQWYHEFMDNSRGVDESLTGAPTLGSFSVGTYAPQRDFALVGVGLNTAFTGYKGMPVGLFINYNAQVGQSDYISNSVNAGIRVDF